MAVESMLDWFNRVFCCAPGTNHRGRSTTRRRNVNAGRKQDKKRSGAKAMAMARRSQTRKVAPYRIEEEDASLSTLSTRESMLYGMVEDEMIYDLDPIQVIPVPDGGRDFAHRSMSQEWRIQNAKNIARNARNIARLRKSKGRSRMASDSSLYSADTYDDTGSLGSRSFSKRLNRTRKRITGKVNTRRE